MSHSKSQHIDNQEVIDHNNIEISAHGSSDEEDEDEDE